MDKAKIIIITSGSSVLHLFLEEIAGIPEIELVGIVYDTERAQPAMSRYRILMRLVKYCGLSCAIKYVIDRLMGRNHAMGYENGSVSVEDSASRRNVSLWTVDDMNSDEAEKVIRDSGAKLGVVVGARILKENIFNIPAEGMINVHQGKIPEYRGGGTVFWALYNDEKELGVSVHKVVGAVDAGAVIKEATVPLEYDYGKYGVNFEDYIADVTKELDVLGSRLLAEAVSGIVSGDVIIRVPDLGAGNRWRRPTFMQQCELRRILKQRYAL